MTDLLRSEFQEDDLIELLLELQKWKKREEAFVNLNFDLQEIVNKQVHQNRENLRRIENLEADKSNLLLIIKDLQVTVENYQFMELENVEYKQEIHNMKAEHKVVLENQEDEVDKLKREILHKENTHKISKTEMVSHFQQEMGQIKTSYEIKFYELTQEIEKLQMALIEAAEIHKQEILTLQLKHREETLKLEEKLKQISQQKIQRSTSMNNDIYRQKLQHIEAAHQCQMQAKNQELQALKEKLKSYECDETRSSTKTHSRIQRKLYRHNTKNLLNNILEP